MKAQGVSQERLDLSESGPVGRHGRKLPERDGVVIVCLGVVGLESDETVQVFDELRRGSRLGTQKLPQKKVGGRIVGSKVRRCTEMAYSFIIGSMREQCGTKS